VEQRGQAQALSRLLELSLNPALVFVRFTAGTAAEINSSMLGLPAPVGQLIMPMFRRHLINNVRTGSALKGLSPQQIEERAVSDLHAVADCLANKQFLAGDGARPSTVDCIALGVLGPMLFYSPPDHFPVREYARKNLPQLEAYVERCKAVMWPTWQESIRIGHEKKRGGTVLDAESIRERQSDK